MKIYRILFLPCLLAVQSAMALDVTTTPGGLAAAVGSQTDITTLTVSGRLDATDFEFIADKLPKLQKLDLGRATVAAFSGDALTTGRTLSAADEIPSYAFAGTSATSITLPSGITAIGEGAFMSTPIKEVTIPATVKTIGLGAFSGCNSLTQITVPASVTEIGTHAFAGCKNLAKADLKAAIDAIPAAAFAGCVKLSKVSYPATVTAIDSAAFAGCSSLKDIAWNGSLHSIGDAAFRATGLQQVDLTGAESLQSIGAWAFANCSSLTIASLPDGVSSVGEGAFFDDAALEQANFPQAATKIENYTYNGATALDPSSLSHSVITEIGDYALRGISNATQFVLPIHLEHIGDYAMEDWTSLQTLEIYSPTVPTTGTDVWAGVTQSSVQLKVDKDAYNLYAEAPQWQDFNIVQSTGGIDDITPDGEGDSGVKAYFSGTDLIVKATTEIDNVRVYDSAARQWVYVEPASDEITIDTAAWNSRIYIVAVVLTDGRTATLKLARR